VAHREIEPSFDEPQLVGRRVDPAERLSIHQAVRAVRR
jgi:hypothetical protein